MARNSAATSTATPTPVRTGKSASGRVARGDGKIVVIGTGSKDTKGSKSAKVAVDPLRVKVAVLRDALGSQAKLAEHLGVSRSQPGKWLSGEERPNPDARRQIQDFEYVWDRLTDERAPEAALVWLQSPNAFLNGATPMTWLKKRGAEDVVAAIDAEESGAFA